MLLTPAQIQRGLQAKYASQLREFPGHFAPLAPTAPDAVWQKQTCERIAAFTRTPLPVSFSLALFDWNLDKCELAGVRFSRGHSYVDQIAKYNRPNPGASWWEDRNVEARPEDELMIAQGDPWVVLLHQRTGEVAAYVVEEGSSFAVTAAPDIGLFLRALGTVALASVAPAELEVFVNSILGSLGPASPKFWGSVASSHADA
jgi:hypothetical protein